MSKKSDLIEELNLKLNESEDEFNKFRERLIHEAIERAGDPQKLKKLQWKIDGIITRSTKLGVVIKLSQMMNDSFLELKAILNRYR
ncbi:MAG: DUF3135 domain-containing protein [Neptuniibacter sp.]